MMQLKEIAQLLGGELQGDDVCFQSVCTDTRRLQPGDLFIALQGPNFDGNDFVDIAFQKQAVAALVTRDIQGHLPFIKVDDTKKALGKLAAYYRSQFSLPFIAVTGSCGKTTTKTMIASILSQVGLTHASEGTLNNDIGVPLTLLRLSKNHQFAVIEMGANHPGEIAYLCEIVKPKVSLITNCAPAHLEGFGSIEGVAKAKGEIYKGLKEEGVAILNIDDEYAPFWRGLLNSNRVLTFGIKNSADFSASQIEINPEGTSRFHMSTPAGSIIINLPLMGAHHVMNALAAAAASFTVGATLNAIQQGLALMSPINKRLVKQVGKQGETIIDDSYNANPLSVEAALRLLAHYSGERIFVFGDMGELGDQTSEFHVKIGQLARALGIEKLYACGHFTQFTVKAFGRNGFHFQDQNALINALKKIMGSHVTVLVKGSRASRMENIVAALM